MESATTPPATTITINQPTPTPSQQQQANSTRHGLLSKFSSELSLNVKPVRVEYYVNENNLKARLQHLYFKNQSSSLRIRVLRFVLKLLSCGLYVARVVGDVEPVKARCHDCPLTNNSAYLQSLYLTEEQFHTNPIINWEAIYWVQRPWGFWMGQVLLSLVTSSEAVLLLYLNYKGNLPHQLFTLRIALELTTSLPILASLLSTPLRNLFSPLFLNCWLAKLALETFLNDLHRSGSQSALSHHLTILSATLVCLVFTSVCGVQHFQRAGHRQLDLFQSTYFVVVTFSTVGYGDYVPDIWPSQLFMVAMICVALIVLPTQVEQLAFTWMERQKLGGSYSSHRAHHERHVVVCSTTLHSDTIMDFLNEFYAHPLLQDYFVVLLSPMELDPTMRLILQVPMWAQRVIYIQGSCLKDGDLVRGRVDAAEACFILAARNYADKVAADEHTILRSWAVKDFAPSVPQYVQILRPENKLHVQFAEHVVCEDEFKYALLANNCLFPGTSTLVTLLLHTSRGQEGQLADEEWMRLYGKCSGNEVYHVKCGESKFFGEYEGCGFGYASWQAHRKFGVCLVGVRPAELPEFYEDSLLLNPGPEHILHGSDICFYLSITKEEDSSFAKEAGKKGNKKEGLDEAEEDAAAGGLLLSVPRESGRNSRRMINQVRRASSTSSATVAPTATALSGSLSSIEVVKGFPPVSPYIGVTPTLCHLLRERRPLCCLQLAQACDHSPTRTAYDYRWPTSTIILAADYASTAIYNFIIPLRAHFRPILNPIILLLEKPPSIPFLDAIAHFPLVYWFHGFIDQLDDLLRAGITLAENVVVVNKELSNSAEEDQLSDCNTIVAVQTMFRFFPRIKMITELSQSSNMRFMSFRADDEYAFHLSRMEKRERERGSHISYMFRLPFAAGSVFSASMLDTLLYQAFVKDYLITFVRLLLGIDQAPGSGYLAALPITSTHVQTLRTYGRLYQQLSATTFEIPIGLYRSTTPPQPPTTHTRLIERAEMESMVGARMGSLGLHCEQVQPAEEESGAGAVCYVVINPDSELVLQEGDLVYAVRPAGVVNSGEVDGPKGKRTGRGSLSEGSRLKTEDILLRRSNSLRVGGRGEEVVGLPNPLLGGGVRGTIV